MSLTRNEKENIIKDFKISSNDTGSVEVQVAMLSAEIAHLTNHLKTNKKDFSAKRGMLKMVSQRKGFLKYLKNNDEASYNKVVGLLKSENQ